MRSSLAIVLVLGSLGACDHRPAPPPQPRQDDGASTTEPVTAPGATPTVAADAGVVADAGAAAAPADAQLVVTNDCLAVADRIAAIIIEATTDPTQKAAIEQDRAKLVRRSAETCTRAGWPEAARTCFLASKSPQELEACGRELATE